MCRSEFKTAKRIVQPLLLFGWMIARPLMLCLDLNNKQKQKQKQPAIHRSYNSLIVTTADRRLFFPEGPPVTTFQLCGACTSDGSNSVRFGFGFDLVLVWERAQYDHCTMNVR